MFPYCVFPTAGMPPACLPSTAKALLAWGTALPATVSCGYHFLIACPNSLSSALLSFPFYPHLPCCSPVTTWQYEAWAQLMKL